MKIEVNDYVRTKNGRIFRWSSLCTTDIEDYMEHTRKILFIEDEIKSSPNIIDLIEIGDYVNGNPVCLIKEDENNRKWIYTDSNYKCGYLEEDIATILTHEQFEKMMYKIGDE